MKTKEELNALKEEVDNMNRKLAELSEDELEQVFGGVAPGSGSGGCGYNPTPSTPSTPSTPTETFTVPVKGEDTVHIDASIRDENAEVKETRQ